MDLLVMAALSVTMGIILISFGLSFIDFGLGSLDIPYSYKTGTNDYYQNPLCRLNSKYFHYRPKGAVVVSKKQWSEIERGMGFKLNEAKRAGKSIGYRAALVEIQDKVKEEKAKTSPSSPYLVLGVESAAPLAEIEKRYKHLLEIYSPKGFVSLDKAFVELAEIRTAQIVRAWNQINLGVGSGSVDGGLY